MPSGSPVRTKVRMRWKSSSHAPACVPCLTSISGCTEGSSKLSWNGSRANGQSSTAAPIPNSASRNISISLKKTATSFFYRKSIDHMTKGGCTTHDAPSFLHIYYHYFLTLLLSIKNYNLLRQVAFPFQYR